MRNNYFIQTTLWILLILMSQSTLALTDYTLDNGLRVLLREDHRTPMVMVQVWYRIGSVDEQRGTTGLSHALEHMMFKGTEQFPKDAFSQMISKNGGNENAFTSDDYTAYYEALPKEALAKALQLEADRMRNLVLTAEDFTKEISVVREERRLRVDDNPDGIALERHMGLAFSASPYRNPTIGWMDDLFRMDIQHLQDWYALWYAPNNATLVIVGDISPKEIEPLIAEKFAALKAKKLPKRPDIYSPPEPQSKREQQLELQVNVPKLMLSYNVPTIANKEFKDDSVALYVLMKILDGGLSTRFEKNIVRKQKVAAGIGTYYSPFSRYDTIYFIQATPQTGKTLEDVKQAVFTEINNLKQNGVTKDEIEQVKLNIKAARTYAKDKPFEQGYSLGQLAMAGLDINLVDNFSDLIDKVSAKDVKNAAIKYLTENRLAITIVNPIKK